MARCMGGYWYLKASADVMIEEHDLAEKND